MKKIRLILLYPVSLIYGLVTWVRNKWFDINWIRSFSFDLKTISIGNLSTGGTGKTPHIIWLAKKLSQKETAILSRGYGRSGKEFEEVLIDSSVSEVGDEPLMIKHELPSQPIYVYADRVVGVTHILAEQPNTDIILLDDCFQHRYITPRINILLTTFDNPFYSDYMLPSGNLREFRMGAKRADMIVVTKCPQQLDTVQKKVIENKIAKYSTAPVVYSQFIYSTPVHYSNQEVLSPKSSVILLTGLANNASLLSHAQSFYEVVEVIQYPDHHEYNKFNMERVLQKINKDPSKNIKVVTTAKDFIKLKTNKELFNMIKNQPFYIQSIEVNFLADGEEKILSLIYS
ncbi:MAG: tetraacyldisaccharide 4'-kinase [Bacteroidetes bacterium]|nr:tetraacyldisaccharide 4'-kinase [Bacteroidota bacterium]